MGIQWPSPGVVGEIGVPVDRNPKGGGMPPAIETQDAFQYLIAPLIPSAASFRLDF